MLDIALLKNRYVDSRARSIDHQVVLNGKRKGILTYYTLITWGTAAHQRFTVLEVQLIGMS